MKLYRKEKGIPEPVSEKADGNNAPAEDKSDETETPSAPEAQDENVPRGRFSNVPVSHLDDTDGGKS